MPFYEYQCSACGAVSEVMQKISDPPLKKCPECGKSKLQKLVSAPVFRLKGSGWYETDFKGDKDNKRNLAGAEKEPEAKPAADTKPDTKAEAPAKPAEAKAEALAPTAASRSASKDKTVKSAPKPAPKRAAAKKAPARKKSRR